MNQDLNKLAQALLEAAYMIITAPNRFYRHMPKSGGLAEPMIFMAVVGVLAGLISTLMGFVGLGYAPTGGAALTAIIATPILVIIGGFISAGIMYLVWRQMGSQENYETAFRCMAYTTVGWPVYVFLSGIAYIGMIVLMAWSLYLTVIASVQVHGIAKAKAWKVFGIVFVCLALLSMCSEHSARSFQDKVQVQKGQQMTPQAAGEIVG